MASRAEIRDDGVSAADSLRASGAARFRLIPLRTSHPARPLAEDRQRVLGARVRWWRRSDSARRPAASIKGRLPENAIRRPAEDADDAGSGRRSAAHPGRAASASSVCAYPRAPPGHRFVRHPSRRARRRRAHSGSRGRHPAGKPRSPPETPGGSEQVLDVVARPAGSASSTSSASAAGRCGRAEAHAGEIRCEPARRRAPRQARRER